MLLFTFRLLQFGISSTLEYRPSFSLFLFPIMMLCLQYLQLWWIPTAYQTAWDSTHLLIIRLNTVLLWPNFLPCARPHYDITTLLWFERRRSLPKGWGWGKIRIQCMGHHWPSRRLQRMIKVNSGVVWSQVSMSLRVKLIHLRQSRRHDNNNNNSTTISLTILGQNVTWAITHISLLSTYALRVHTDRV